MPFPTLPSLLAIRAGDRPPRVTPQRAQARRSPGEAPAPGPPNRLVDLSKLLRGHSRARGSILSRAGDKLFPATSRDLFCEPIEFSLRTVGRLIQNHISKNNMTSADGFGYGGRVLEIVRVCERPFRTRQGGSPQRFCGASCRKVFWSALRWFGEQALANGVLTMTDIRGAVTAACTLPRCAELLSPLPNTTRTSSARPDEPLR
jgi:hypothetical protein